MAEPEHGATITLQELMVSTLAMTAIKALD
jgi:hypothetical protein